MKEVEARLRALEQEVESTRHRLLQQVRINIIAGGPGGGGGGRAEAGRQLKGGREVRRGEVRVWRRG